jgi:hypothetical protein
MHHPILAQAPSGVKGPTTPTRVVALRLLTGPTPTLAATGGCAAGGRGGGVEPYAVVNVKTIP